MSPESASFDTRNEDAKKASKQVEDFLRSCTKVMDVKNVEDSRKYQVKDIDLLCILEVGDNERTVSIEIKGDTKAHQTGNFFLETVSNKALGTQGCFLKSQAHLLFYYLLATDRLYIFPMRKMQTWFRGIQKQMSAGSRKRTYTVDAGGRYQHTTLGQCVNIEYTKRCLEKENIPFREIEEMGKWRCTLTDFCLEDI